MTNGRYWLPGWATRCGGALRTGALIALLLTVPAGSMLQAQELAAGPGGTGLPFTTEEEILEFLRTAEVVEMENVGTGVTRPVRATLEKDGVRARAIFHYVDTETRNQRVGQRFYTRFQDTYRAQCAAYTLARLLGLSTVPPTVCRAVRRRNGSVQLWVEGGMTERERAEQNLRPPGIRRWILQLSTIRLFDELLFNVDRHPGNILIDPDWTLWMIDHTRGFQRVEQLMDVDQITLCERDLWQRLRTISDDTIEDSLSGFFEGSQVRALLKRRELLVAHIQGLIDAHGEDRILFSRDELMPS